MFSPTSKFFSQKSRVVVLACALLTAERATAVPLEVVYTGQLVNNNGNPITSLATYAPPGQSVPARSIGALRFRFYRQASGGSPVTFTVGLRASISGAALSTPSTFPATCSPDGNYPFTSCAPVTVNSNGVFQVSFFLTAADFNTLFAHPSAAAGVHVETELVYVNIDTGEITSQSVYWSPDNPAPTRQRFTSTAYALKVPVDDSTVGYDSSGNVTVKAGGITDAQIAAGGISTPGKVSGNAITSGTIGGATNINTTGSITAQGVVHSTSGGIKFPDNTVQTTAAGAGPDSGTNCGMAILNIYNGWSWGWQCKGQWVFSGCPAGYTRQVVCSNGCIDNHYSCVKN